MQFLQLAKAKLYPEIELEDFHNHNMLNREHTCYLVPS